MNKRYIILIVMLFTVLLFSLGVAHVDEIEKKPPTTFEFPLSLQEIEEEAFLGTAAEEVYLPNGLLRIGDNAFEGSWSLTDIYIPDTTVYIADSAFSITSDLTIHGVDNSYAKDWANEHEITFVIDDIWDVITPIGRSQNTRTYPIRSYTTTISLFILFSLLRNSYYEFRSRRPQDRPELNLIDYRFP